MTSNFNLDGIVSELRSARVGVRKNEQRNVKAQGLPSRPAVEGIVAGLFAALFPDHTGVAASANGGIDYFVGHTLNSALQSLHEQVRRELRFNFAHAEKTDAELLALSDAIVRDFAAELPRVYEMVESDIVAAFEGDPSATSTEEILLSYPGITAVVHHRLAHPLYRLGAPILARIIAELAHSKTGIDIHPGAQIGASFFIDHGTGVVIGETAVIGERVRLYQAVTLGAKRFSVDENGALVKGAPRHPIVEDDVVIYAGATILGRVTIGRGSVIGGNVWLTRSVAPESRVLQAQTRSEEFDHGAGI